MKTIATLIYIIGFQYISLAQGNTTITSQASDKNKNASQVSFFIASASTGPQDVVITSIPVSDQALASVNIKFDLTGSFSFKKDAALDIPLNHEVFIEDKLTGKVFNLKTLAAYKFNVDKSVADRFVLHILDKTNPEEAVVSN